MRLNLGCGSKLLEGYVNVDLHGHPDQKVDLFALPWPWEDASVDAVACHHFLEHVRRFRDTWREMHRILKPGGTLWVRVPHFRSPEAPWPEQHVNQFSTITFDSHLTSARPYDIGAKLFETVSLRHRFPPKLRVLSPLANLFPVGWDWFGFPVSEIEWIGKRL